MKLGLFVGIFTRTFDFELREHYRYECNTSAYNHKFFVGLPVTDANVYRKQQGRLVDRKQHLAISRLKEEGKTFGDIVVLPYRDTYQDLTLKTILLLRYAFRKKVDVVVKIDEEICINLDKIPTEDPLYFGGYMFSGTEYGTQKGYDNTTVPYFSGNTYGLSRSVLRWFGKLLWNTSLFYEMYGSSSEDVNVGRWVKMLNKSIEYKLIKGLTVKRTHLS